MITKVLITGGIGYVGGRIAASLSRNSNLFLRIGSRRAKVAKPIWLQHGEIVPFDLNINEQIDSACQGIDCIIHLAALNEIESAANPELAIIVNSLGTLKMLRAAENAGVKRIIYFSTAHVYGAPLVGEINELTLPRPVHPYAITHRMAEDFVLSARDTQKLEGIVVRLSNSFGPPADTYADRWTLIVNDLCRQAVIAKELVLRTAGLQKRDFITLSDVERAVIHLLFLPYHQIGNGLFNLGGECSLPIIEIASLVASRCEQTLGFLPPIQRPEPTYAEKPEKLEYRIDKLKATGFALQGRFEEEIDATLRFCQEVYEGNRYV